MMWRWGLARVIPSARIPKISKLTKYVILESIVWPMCLWVIVISLWTYVLLDAFQGDRQQPRPEVSHALP
jgi:hypothetical protein